MKIRQGFVSNSSSSSFIIRGIKVNMNDYLKALIAIGDIPDPGFTPQEWKDPHKVFDEIFMALPYPVKSIKKLGLNTQEDKFYFDENNDPVKEIIIGKDRGDLDDGVIGVIPDNDPQEDLDIENKIKSLNIPIPKNEVIQTYAQFVSNDNC